MAFAAASDLWPIAPAHAELDVSAAIREPGFRRWHNDLRIMVNLDKHVLVEAGVLEDDDERGWVSFRDDPYTWARKAPDRQAVALYRLIDSRRPAALTDGATQ